MDAIAIRRTVARKTLERDWSILGLFAAFAALFLIQAQAAAARGAPESFADLAEAISPAVVNITTSTAVAQTAERPQIPEGSPLEDFFKDFLDRQNRPEPRRGAGFGIYHFG